MVEGRGGRAWLLLLGGVVLFFLGLLGWSVRQASRGVSPLSDPAYYAKGLHHDQGQAGVRRALAEGWTFSGEVRKGVLVVHVADRAGDPVVGATVGFLRSGGEAPLLLAESRPGTYAVALPGLAGPISGRLEVRRGAAALTRPLLVNP